MKDLKTFILESINLEIDYIKYNDLDAEGKKVADDIKNNVSYDITNEKIMHILTDDKDIYFSTLNGYLLLSKHNEIICKGTDSSDLLSYLREYYHQNGSNFKVRDSGTPLKTNKDYVQIELDGDDW